jgi:enoyl-CoA hydratase/carnithine racemase
VTILWEIADGIGTIALPGPADEPLTPADVARVAAFLAAPELRGVVLRVAGDPAGSAAIAEALAQAIADATVPVVAAIGENCGGAALELARACPFRWASPDARIGVTGADRFVSGAEAATLGIVDRAVPDVEARAADHLRALTAGRPVALVRAIMASIRNAGRMSLDDALAEETALFCAVAGREDA